MKIDILLFRSVLKISGDKFAGSSRHFPFYAVKISGFYKYVSLKPPKSFMVW